ncbi:permease protein, ABC-type oligopeptide transporter [Aurantimonas manganoxydans SI85-9A1]|uniref:Permease protein, ABC-type oligopeptide transporter n=1 Tax=Aurantimonas manganoxydans (strain ATCC BAA-1229 / DSM 21871 / SI85-9A1) TaxID=287752 RepID=Q1YDI3_AURMS|nr:ABC transporter permease [Aurantimonas manganoxydans]EAS48314.1 permease protein, ABC-type oligopeptide transporter [Aurantimonas manganoxydans SI85-9A1]
MSETPHFVSREPFDSEATVAVGSTVSLAYMEASQSRLIWWRFLRHRVAVVSLAFLVVSYLSILVVEFLAPYDMQSRHTDFIFAPPQAVHLFHEGSFVGPFVYPLDFNLDLDTLQREYTPDTSQPLPLRFFCQGDPYEFWGLVSGDRHLVCPPEGGSLFLLGTDRLGRDMLSRILSGARISLTVGLVGVTLSFILGITIGGLAGYFGGWIDSVVQRVTEILRSLPELPLWLALSAALPVTWSPLLIYFGITLILALLDWPGLARAVRSKLFALREEDFVVAAEMLGARPRRIIFRHLLPNFMSHLIASASLSIPTMILAETALSFLGLGLRPPITSWGVLLSEAQNIEAVALYPWLLLPMVPVILTVLAFSFVGDGLRDAVDPHHHH